MESLARRGVRTTVAVAGLVALGIGTATPAFAAPSDPDVSGIGNGPTAQAPGQPGTPATTFTEVSDALTTLPGMFKFEPPAVNGSVRTDAVAASAGSEQATPDAGSAAPDADPAGADPF